MLTQESRHRNGHAGRARARTAGVTLHVLLGGAVREIGLAEYFAFRLSGSSSGSDLASQ